MEVSPYYLGLGGDVWRCETFSGLFVLPHLQRLAQLDLISHSILELINHLSTSSWVRFKCPSPNARVG